MKTRGRAFYLRTTPDYIKRSLSLASLHAKCPSWRASNFNTSTATITVCVGLIAVSLPAIFRVSIDSDRN